MQVSIAAHTMPCQAQPCYKPCDAGHHHNVTRDSSTLSFAGVLNAIDGVAAQEGKHQASVLSSHRLH